jgi:hypothetical protein
MYTSAFLYPPDPPCPPFPPLVDRGVKRSCSTCLSTKWNSFAGKGGYRKALVVHLVPVPASFQPFHLVEGGKAKRLLAFHLWWTAYPFHLVVPPLGSQLSTFPPNPSSPASPPLVDKVDSWTSFTPYGGTTGGPGGKAGT